MNTRYICMISVFLLFFSSCSITKKDHRDHNEDIITELTADDHGYPKFHINGDKTDNHQEDYLLAESTMIWDNVALYFHDSKGEKLVPEMRKIPKSTDKEFVKGILQALIQGPVTETLNPVISRDTKINKIEQIDSILTIDLSYEFLQSKDLLAARTSIANTITSLEPYKYVNILVENHKLTKDGKPTGSVVGLISRNSNNYSRIEEEEVKKLNNSGINTVFMDLYFQDCENSNLVPEVRNIVYNKDELPKAIVEELIKGPLDLNGGKKPTIPKGTVLKDIKLIKDDDTGEITAVLYFSKEFKLNFKGSISKESLMLGSLVLSLSGVSDISYLKVFYENDNDEYIDLPIVSFPLNERLGSSLFKQYIGRTVKVYYGNANGKGLSSEYRAIKRDDRNIPQCIINKLTTSPKYTESIKLMPDNIEENEVSVNVEGKTAFVNLPGKFFNADEKKTNYILLLYSIVNSLTDPINSSTIEEVQFLVDNKIADNIKGISLSEPFIRKPEIS